MTSDSTTTSNSDTVFVSNGSTVEFYGDETGTETALEGATISNLSVSIENSLEPVASGDPIDPPARDVEFSFDVELDPPTRTLICPHCSVINFASPLTRVFGDDSLDCVACGYPLGGEP